MAESLLTLAAHPDVTQGALRMGASSLEKQLVDGDVHPFARLLAGHAPGVGAGLEGEIAPLPALLDGKLTGQLLAVDGKELPDAARLLTQAGLVLEDGEAMLHSDADPDLATLAQSLLATGMEEEVPVAGPGAVSSQAPSWILKIASGEQASRPGPGQEALALASRTRTGTELHPSTEAQALAVRQPPAAAVVTATAQEPILEAGSMAMPEQARVVSAAVQQALQQRAGEQDARESRFGDLIRTAATQGTESTSRTEAPVGVGSHAGANAPAQAPALLPATAVAIPLRQAGWDQALGERVQWMVGSKLQGAEIRLNPAHLGPMEVRIQIQNDQANINFTAQHGMVREALEAAIPRLREMLGESGLQLNDVTVSDQSLAEQRRQEGQASFAARSATPGAGGLAEEEAPMLAVTPLREGAGTIDFFA
jgi:hypothetical protein